VISKKSKDRKTKSLRSITSSGFPGGHFGKTTAAASPGANDSALEATSNHRGWNGFSCMLSSQQSTPVPTLLLHSMSSTKKNVSKIIGLFLTKKMFVPKIKGLFLLGFVPKI